MQPTLFAYLYERYGSDPAILEDLSPYLEDVVASTGLHGGVQSIEVTLARRPLDAFLTARWRLGKRLLIVDETAGIVAEGTVIGISVIETGNRLTCVGPFWDICFRQVYNDTASWISSGTTSGQIKDILTKECPAVNADQGNIEETNTANYPWQISENAKAGDLIPRLAGMSDSQHREWYFWLRTPPLQGLVPGKPVPYFKPQDLTSVDFWFDREDCPIDGLEVAPSVQKLANDVRIMYRDSVGTQKQTTSLADADSQAEYWLQEIWNVPLARVPETVANQYRAMYLARYKKEQQSISFRLNGWIWDQMGVRQPLWKVIQKFPCNVGIRNLMPEAAMLAGIDREQVFAVAAARYSYASNSLTITPDLEEKSMENLVALWSGAG